MQKPAAWKWFLVYIGTLGLTYVLIVLASLGMVGYGLMNSGPEATEMLFMGVIMGAVCFPLMIAVIAAAFLPRRKWSWTYQILVIALGTSSCLWLPLCIYLLMEWTKPEVKDYYGV